MREVRLRFCKQGRLKYISHLDINRALSRAFRRADIPLWFTEGYNPHAYMSFSLPLSLGVESLCEYVDIRLIDEISNDEIKKRMNDVLPADLRILDVYDDFRDSSEIMYSDYVFKISFTDCEKAAEKIKSVFELSEILAQKKGKQGRKKVLKDVDIKQYIDKYNISVRDDLVVINVRLMAGNEKNLNPTLLFDTLIRHIETDFEWKSISRLSLLDKNYKEFR
ncbi:MAG TPA: TIGR03936 family radical SAM-associated protein [Candidatus Eubacterium faecigallinarum]|nr:TIGR03936 family radical SAM-associated protein [Candidatus Eubacterium faecigallinarum]